MKEDCDIIHAADLDTYIPSILAAKIKNKKIIYDIFDFYGDMVALPKFIRNAVAKFDTFLMKFSDAIVIVDPTRVKQLNIKEGSAVVIYNSPSEEIIRGYQGLSREGNLFRIFYAGGLYRDRDFKTVIDVIKKNKGIMFEIAGWGEYEKEILQLINNEPDVTFIGSLPYPEVLKKTLQSDLLIALYNPAIPNNRFSSPNKIFEAMMCRKPIIVSDGTTMADIVRENDCGVVVPFGDLKSLEDAVLVLCNDPVLSEKLGVNGRKAFDEKYRWEIMEKKLLSVYDSLYRKDPSRYQRIFNGDR